MTDTLHLTGLEFFGYHGTEPWEKEVGRPFVVDAELTLDMTAPGRSDRLADALDYRDVYAAIKKVVEGESHELIERLAWRALEALLAVSPRVEQVRVRVHKPQAPIGGPNRAVTAEISRTRAQFDREPH